MTAYDPDGRISMELWGLSGSRLPEPTLEVVGDDLLAILPDLEGNNREYTLEELFIAQSSAAINGYRRPNKLAERIIYHRAALGYEVIIEIWDKAGYINLYSHGESINAELRPVSKNPEISHSADFIFTPQLVLKSKGDKMGWGLFVSRRSEGFLGFAEWNDREGIRKLAEQALDSEQISIMVALLDPEEATELAETDTKNKAEVALYHNLKESALDEEVLKEYANALESLQASAMRIFNGTTLRIRQYKWGLAHPTEKNSPYVISLLYEIAWNKSDIHPRYLLNLLNLKKRKTWRRERREIWRNCLHNMESMGYCSEEVPHRISRNFLMGRIRVNDEVMKDYKRLANRLKTRTVSLVSFENGVAKEGKAASLAD